MKEDIIEILTNFFEQIENEFLQLRRVSSARFRMDWACVTWDEDFRYSPEGWKSFSFVESKWNNINKEERKLYLKNAYRVLFVVPEGDAEDAARKAEYYDETFEYLRGIGILHLR